MSDAAAPAAPASPKKAAKSKTPKKPKTASSHPPVADMVIAAIKSLKERKGSSLAAIKKYVGANYKVDIVKIAPFIRKFLKKAVLDGKLVQTKGQGAAGSFRLPSGEKTEKKKAKTPKKPKAKKPAGEAKAKKPKAKKAKKPAAKKAAKPKKAKTSKPKKAKKSPKKAAKSKGKKTAKK